MITRELQREDANRAIIKHIYPETKEFLCAIQLVDNDTIIQQNDNIVFPADAFELTPEELEELGVKQYTEFEEV